MIKTIKVKKTKDLSELIAYISVSGIKDANFVSNYENIVSADHSGQITTVGKFYNDTFTVEVEKEITKNTPFEWLVEVNKWGIHEEQSCSISGIEDEDTLRIYALLDEELQLIWEAK